MRPSRRNTAYLLLFVLLIIHRVNSRHKEVEQHKQGMLDVWMMSQTGCDGIGCEDKLGGSRIWCTNMCAGMRVLGHRVTFSRVEPPTHHDVLVVSDVLLKKSRKWATNEGNVARLASLAKVFVICKPNGVPIRILNMAHAVPYGSIIHLQTEIARGFDPKRAWLAKHTEVPLDYWKFAKSKTHSMYKYIKKHEPRTGGFSADVPARVCYHGSHFHVLSPGSDEIWSALNSLSEIIPLKVFIFTGGGQKPKHIDENKVSVLRWESVDGLYASLQTCDLGIVPNLAVSATTAQSVASLPYPLTQLTFKHSSNGGRAFVYAQVGVPTLGHPEFEYMEMINVAGIDPMVAVALGRKQWYHQALEILNNPSLRVELSESLRNFAEENLSIVKEATKFESEIMRHIGKL